MFVNMSYLHLCLQHTAKLSINDHFFYTVEPNKDSVVKKKRPEHNAEVVAIDSSKSMKIFCSARFLYILILKKINCLNNVHSQAPGIINLSQNENRYPISNIIRYRVLIFILTNIFNVRCPCVIYHKKFGVLLNTHLWLQPVLKMNNSILDSDNDKGFVIFIIFQESWTCSSTFNHLWIDIDHA